MQVLIRVKAFGLNRSEMFTRQGHSPNVKFPRILGIEAVGVVEEAPGTSFKKGDMVATAMGGTLILCCCLLGLMPQPNVHHASLHCIKVIFLDFTHQLSAVAHLLTAALLQIAVAWAERAVGMLTDV